MRVPASVLFVGSPFWCRYLAGLLNEGGFLDAHVAGGFWRWLGSRRRSICLVGLGMPDTTKRVVYHFGAYLLDKLGLVEHRVVYWIGSDVMRARSGSPVIGSAVNVAGSPWLAEEIRERGYECQTRLFPVRLPSSESFAFPSFSRLQILCYLPDSGHELHGSGEIRAVAARFPDIDFRIVGGRGAWWSKPPDNVRFLGWTDHMVDHLAGCHVLLRRTQHDSFSAFVREGIVAHRYVVFTHAVPGVTHVPYGDLDTLYAVVDDLNRRLKAGGLAPCQQDPGLIAELTDTDSQLRALAHDYR
jgi:hypothetical protein